MAGLALGKKQPGHRTLGVKGVEVNRPQGARLFRFGLLVFIQFWLGLTLVLADAKEVFTQATWLASYPSTVALDALGHFYMGGGIALLLAFWIGGVTLRVAHALFAGYFFLTASLSIGSTMTGFPLVGFAAGYQLLVSFSHYRAGTDQPKIGKSNRKPVPDGGT